MSDGTYACCRSRRVSAAEIIPDFLLDLEVYILNHGAVTADRWPDQAAAWRPLPVSLRYFDRDLLPHLPSLVQGVGVALAA
jgi:hypothetical protein